MLHVGSNSGSWNLSRRGRGHRLGLSTEDIVRRLFPSEWGEIFL